MLFETLKGEDGALFDKDSIKLLRLDEVPLIPHRVRLESYRDNFRKKAEAGLMSPRTLTRMKINNSLVQSYTNLENHSGEIGNSLG
eukprot:756370-Hanusia_phi.AAC.8